MAQTIKVAAIQAQATEVKTAEEFEQKILTLARNAVAQGAELLVFPEDVGLWLEMAGDSPRASILRAAASVAAATAKLHQELIATHAGAAPAETGGPAVGHPEALSVFSQFFDALVKRLPVSLYQDWLSAREIDKTCVEAFAAAAKTCNVPIVGGSLYESRDDGMFVTCYVFDADGSVAGKYDKHHLVPLELFLGAKPSTAPIQPIPAGGIKIGACICYDLNFGPTEADLGFRAVPVSEELKANGAQILCAGSLGKRPYPDYPYVPAVDAPQTRRAQETGLAVVRAYQTGWLVPGCLYMDGLSDIVGPDGAIITQAYADNRKTEMALVADVPLA